MDYSTLQHTSIYQMREDSDDSDGEGGMGNVNRLIMRPPDHSGKAKKGHLCFDASFETGNLGRVDLISEHEYDLFIRPDTCSPRIRFWFNFTVENVKQDQRVIFNIVNLSKDRNLYYEDMTPLVRSTSRPKWQRIPRKHVFYHKSPVHRGHYILSISFGFDKEDEVFQFALSPPFSYSRLQNYLPCLETKASYLNESFRREVLGCSVQKRHLDLITIGTVGKSFKRIVVIMARIHPGDSPSSFVCQGILELLVSTNAIARTLRKHVIFKIIPMLNPDGVFLGNYRSSVMGYDLNRSWHKASVWCHPTIKATIDMLHTLDKIEGSQLDFVIDVHAHSSLKGCFIYGNTYEDIYRYERHLLFPKLLSKTTDDCLIKNSIFNDDPKKIGTARRYLCQVLSNIVNCYTFEVSLFGYVMKGSDVTIPYTEDSYMRCGRNLVTTILKYYHVTGIIPMDLGREIKGKKRRKIKYKLIDNSYIPRPQTSRDQALLHIKNLNIGCKADCEMQESKFDQKKKDDFLSSTSTTMVVIPQSSLSIIDFNLIIRDEFNRDKLKK